ncbi:MAG: hypothetical protein PUF72_10040 [Clostridiales bacterium]|nr:hypothetical protein [Clostridiales bacterium]
MQHVLSFKVGDNKYVSKTFDFEALCLINDAHICGSGQGPMRICSAAVDYMFEGTDATPEIIAGLDAFERARLCSRLWDFYTEAISQKKE